MPEDGAPVLSMDDPELEVQETKGKSKRPQGKARPLRAAVSVAV